MKDGKFSVGDKVKVSLSAYFGEAKIVAIGNRYSEVYKYKIRFPDNYEIFVSEDCLSQG